MKKLFYLLCCLLFLPVANGCSDQEDELGSDTPPRNGLRTVLVYIVANNSLSGFVEEDVEEMMQGIGKVNTDARNLLVYIDDKDQTVLLRLRNGGGKGGAACDTLRRYGSQLSTDPSVMASVLRDAYGNYPADSYGLVYWSHGDGWVNSASTRASTRWMGQDGDDFMDLAELCEALDAAPHLDFLMFDACFMQSVEVAYELRSYADYYIGSPTETPGPGAPYDAVVPMMFGENAAVSMASAYFDYYENKYEEGDGLENGNWTAGTAIGVIQTAFLGNLASATRQLLPETSEDFDWMRGQVFDYDRRGFYSSSHVGYYDMRELVELLAAPAALAEWQQAFEAAVAYWDTTPAVYSQFLPSDGGMFSMSRAHGLTHYIPSEQELPALADYRTLDWYTDAGLSQMGW